MMLGPVHFAAPLALALLLLVPLFSPLRALAVAAVVLALAQPSHRPATSRPWVTVHSRDGKLAADVQRAAAALPNGGQIALHSDGREREGSLLRVAEELRARGISLHYAFEPPVPELGVQALELPQPAQLGTPFALEATVAASVATTATVQLAEDGKPIETREEALPAGETVLRFRAVARAGEASYRVTLTPHGPDADRTDNTLERRVRASGRPRVLLLDSEPAWSDAFATLLRAADFEVDTHGKDPDGHEFVILSDMPAQALSPGFLRALTRYVQDGGGLLVAGGEHAFGPGGYRGTALERLLPVTLEGADARNEASLALVLAIDKSGSMAGDKLERAKEAALATAALLPEDAYLGVLGFDVEATRIVRLARARAEPAAIARLAAGGGTALFPALDAAYADLAGVQAQLKHVVVLTDGQTQEESLGDLVRAMHADGITISTVGLGEDVQRGLLGELAKLARGRAYFTRDPSQIPRLFVEETERVARSLVVERLLKVKQVGTASFLRGVPVEQAPPLRGLVHTRARPSTTLLASDDGAPLLARMRVGEGWSLAWTSDLKPRWSAAWFAWPAHARLFAQLVREHMRRADTLSPRARMQDGTLELRCDVLDERGRFVNGLTGSAQSEAGSAPFVQVGPGRYVAQLEAPPGSRLQARLGDRRGSTTAPSARPPITGSGRELLAAVARRTGGGPLPPTRAPRSIDAQGSTERQQNTDTARPMWPTALWLALGAFLADLARRRWAPERRT